MLDADAILEHSLTCSTCVSIVPIHPPAGFLDLLSAIVFLNLELSYFLTEILVHVLHGEGGDKPEALLQLSLQQPGEEVEAD